MHPFKDSAGHEWEVAIDPYTIELLQKRLGIDLYDLRAGVEKIFSGGSVFVNVIYLLCVDKTGADKEPPTFSEREFCRGFNADVLVAARKALQAELLFFCPEAAKENLRRAFELQDNLVGRVVAKLQAESANLAQLTEEELDDLATETTREIKRDMMREAAHG